MTFRPCVWFALAVAPLAFGQNVFMAVEDGGLKIVKQVRLRQPIIEDHGKPLASNSREFALLKATVYRAGLVTLTDFRAGTWHVETVNGDRFNYEFRIAGTAKADADFSDCFIVIEATWGKNTGVLSVEIPNLQANRSTQIEVAVPLEDRIEDGRYRVHFFAGGIELLHSRMPPEYISKQKEKTAALLGGAKDYPAIAWRTPATPYPEELKGQNLTGSARVRYRVNNRGDVVAPELIEATTPIFGRAALAAIVNWKYDPALKDRRLTDSTLTKTFNFNPPAK